MSERDSDPPSDDSWNDDAPKSERPPKPAADGIRRIDTVIGQHMPALIEEEVLKKAAAAQTAKPEPKRREHVARVEVSRAETNDEPEKKWRSPLQVGPDWLVALKSIPPKLVAIAGGGIFLGVLLTLAMRGCSENRHVQELDDRVALLERTVGVSLDGGRADDAASSPTVVSAVEDAGVTMAVASATSSTPTNNAACATAKSDAYAAWQDALVKAKQNAAPAESQCSHILTHDHKQSCMATATAGVRLVQSARDATMKGGAAARDAAKNVRDGSSAIATAKAASQAAFAACQDDNEL
jgi:hypothetical protein